MYTSNIKYTDISTHKFLIIFDDVRHCEKKLPPVYF